MKALIIGNKARYEKFYPSNAFTDSLEKIYIPMGTPEEEILKQASDADFLAADAIASVSGNLIEQMPNLKIIHSEGVGFDRIDCEVARKRGILVCNNQGVNADAVAEQTILLILGLLRQVVQGDYAVRAGGQIARKEQMMVGGITELGDCKVGLIGFGDIAKSLVKRLQPFGCSVFYYATHRKDKEVEDAYEVSWMELPELIRTCDIVSIHVPVTADTKGMVNEEFLKQMKNNAYLINTARGEIVDNQALCKALTEGWIAGAGLDTVSPEPVQLDNPLLQLPKEIQDKILFSPHIGGVTTSMFKRAHRNIWTAFEKVSKNERPEHIVNGLFHS
jgi:phosphoglycerate dehydrogenase-like enzyme